MPRCKLKQNCWSERHWLFDLHICKLTAANIAKETVQSLTFYAKGVLDIGILEKNGTLPYCPLVLQTIFYMVTYNFLNEP